MQSAFDSWARGYGVIAHDELTRARLTDLIQQLERDALCSTEDALALLCAADRLCNMTMWLTVHMTYARQLYLDGRRLQTQDFKPSPEGHTGGALNMAPAYIGYLLANALSGRTSAWLMGQGHCVAAIDAANVLVGNLEAEQAQRYPCTDAGLSRLCQDFYGYEIGPDGRPAAPLGSHVNVYTAGGISEGGYLGFAELQYVHMPLPGQELVVFLSDGAFEEQRGSDWAPRWWRGEDSGLVMPIMIANGRRIDQRTTMSQQGGVHWFREHLRLHGFSPLDIDGRDPAAFAWAILTMARQLKTQYQEVQDGLLRYPVLLPYAVAETVKGYGFPGAGTNAAHNLPLPGNPAQDSEAAELFNLGCHSLYVDLPEWQQARALFNQHAKQQRVKEKDHYLRQLQVVQPRLPELIELEPTTWHSPMAAIDDWISRLISANPGHRVRIGNPDEMRSNRMNKTLDLLKHRVTAPEPLVAEALDGGVITALNEEAVVAAALANKQGLNLAVSYEAFAVKMLGAMRQETIFARSQLEAGRQPQWLSVPIIATSHTWENGKNEQSHQDPTLCEAWLGEMADVAPVLFPFDAATACACLHRLYSQRGRVATLVAAKGHLPLLTDSSQAMRAVAEGAIVLSQDAEVEIQLLAMGGYQVQQALRALEQLRAAGIGCELVALIEPGRLREPRDAMEAAYVQDNAGLHRLIPARQKRLFISHCRAEPIIGTLRRLDTGPEHSRFLGYRNRGGTLDVLGMLYANGQTWAHLLVEAATLLKLEPERLLGKDQLAAVRGSADPRILA